MLSVVISLLAAAAVQPPPDAGGRTLPEDPSLVARRALAASSRGDPAIAEVQAAAARCADPRPQAASRAAALLPRLTAELRFDERSYRVTGLQGTGEVDYAHYAPGWLAGVRATWELSALVTPPAERVDAKGALDRARRRDEAVRKATALYFDRRQLRIALALAPPAAPLERAAAELEIERLAAELDALTGGAFTGQLAGPLR